MPKAAPGRSAPADRRCRAAKSRPTAGGVPDSGVVLTLGDLTPDSKMHLKTAAGEMEFSLGDVPYGKRLPGLDGRVEIERVPAVVAVAQTAADEDYPAAAMAKDGTAYVAYLAFTRGADFQGVRERLSAFDMAPQTPVLNPGQLRRIDKPQDLDYLREPVGGERLYVRAYKDGKWAAPVALTEPPGGRGGDKMVELYRPAVTIDGSGKLWVFYSAHLDADADLDGGNWELMARSYDPAAGKVGEAINLSNAPGADFMPAAATDAAGRAWVAWVGSRGEHFNVFTSHQPGEAGGAGGTAFSPAQRVTKSASQRVGPGHRRRQERQRRRRVGHL